MTEGGVNVIDARDLAAVLAATLEPGRGPRRYMVGGTLVSLPALVDVFRRATGRRILAVRTPGAVYRGLGAILDAIRRVIPFNTVFTAEGMQLLTRAKNTDDSAVHDDLGVAYRDPELDSRRHPSRPATPPGTSPRNRQVPSLVKRHCAHA